MTSQTFPGNADQTYANLFTFMGRPLSRALDAADAVVLGVPYDLATTARPGARYGPNAIRQASSFLRWEDRRWPWRFTLGEVLRIIDYGDISYEVGNHHAMVETLVETAASIAGAGRFLLGLGGDHYVSLPLLRGVAAHHDKIALVHFDAHTDTDPLDTPFNHGAMFHQAMREDLFEAQHSIQVGIRTDYDYDTHRLEVCDAAWVNEHPAADTAARIIARTAGLPVYLSVDIDCLDPAFAPGTGTPVAGGLSSSKLLQILRALGALDIVAADVMEVAPAYDSAQVTALAAATVALELLYLRAARRRES